VPEFGVSAPLLPQSPPTFAELGERIAAVRRANAERQAAIDQFFIDQTRSLTNIDLTEAVDSGRRSEALGGVVGAGESILIDQILSARISSSADLPAGVDERGRVRLINQNTQTAFVLDQDGNLVEVQMLPMWNADP
jgi:hypothetical protein